MAKFKDTEIQTFSLIHLLNFPVPEANRVRRCKGARMAILDIEKRKKRKNVFLPSDSGAHPQVSEEWLV
jgi:hypothetical protein